VTLDTIARGIKPTLTADPKLLALRGFKTHRHTTKSNQ